MGPREAPRLLGRGGSGFFELVAGHLPGGGVGVTKRRNRPTRNEGRGVQPRSKKGNCMKKYRGNKGRRKRERATPRKKVGKSAAYEPAKRLRGENCRLLKKKTPKPKTRIAKKYRVTNKLAKGKHQKIEKADPSRNGFQKEFVASPKKLKREQEDDFWRNQVSGGKSKNRGKDAGTEWGRNKRGWGIKGRGKKVIGRRKEQKALRVKRKTKEIAQK